MRRRAFLASPLLLAAPGARVAGPLPGGGARAARCRSRATTAPIPTFAPSGGTSPAGSATRAAPTSGIQVTFFRNRPNVAEDNPSAFAPRQLVFAHAAIADPAHGRLRHDQRAARAVFEPRRRGNGDDAGVARRLVAGARRGDLRREDRRARLRAGSLVPRDAADAGAGRPGLLAQGAAAAAGELVLQPAAARRRRIDRGRRSNARGHRARLARSRVVEPGDGAGGGRLGLGRRQPRRRRCADGLSHARPRGWRPLGRRRVSPRRRPDRHPRARRRCASIRGGAGSRRERASRTRSSSRCARAAATTRSRRCSTTRNSTRARRPGPSTGKARCASCAAGVRQGWGISSSPATVRRSGCDDGRVPTMRPRARRRATGADGVSRGAAGTR